MKPFSEACLENRAPILERLLPLLAGHRRLLEIGSGTGQHAAYFAPALPHLIWQTSDREQNHAGIRAWLAEAPTANLPPPLALDVDRQPWPITACDAVFSANTVHIMAWESVQRLFTGVAQVLEHEGRFILYGPFNYAGAFTSASNARFDQWLKARDPLSGIRDFEALDALARTAGLALEEDFEMPVNNRLLCWRKQAQSK